MEEPLTTTAAATASPVVAGTPQPVAANATNLPAFLVKHDKGLCVDTKQLPNAAEFFAAVQRIFAENQYFRDINYTCFIKLLYDVGPPLPHIDASSPLVRLASDVVEFKPERRALYQAIKITRDLAEYIFEPVFIVPKPKQENLPPAAEQTNPSAEKNAAQQANITTGSQPPPPPPPIPTSLRFDEFIAHAWNKGVRFGIDEAAVRDAITSGKRVRCIIAKALPMQLGRAAGIKELARELHRDDTPAELSGGKLDLSQFKNRFPQISKGVKLIKKIPMVLGIPGYDLAGRAIVPPLPADFDLSSLAGPDTCVEQADDGEEYIISQMSGFLSLDSKTNQISITEKIINREGVSARTGNLQLSGDEYEEYGQVQNQRLLKGKNITVHSDVFGTVSSSGGYILLKHNLIGGVAINQAGDITLENVASGAVLKTKQGTVTIKRAEKCQIIGTQVSIIEAFNCDIFAEHVSIKVARGCTITAKSIHIGNAAPHKNSDMSIFIRVPDLSEFDKKSQELALASSTAEAELLQKQQELEKLMQQPAFKTYRMVAGKIKKKEMLLSPEQQTRFRKLVTMVEPILRQNYEITTKISAIKQEQQQRTDQLNQLEAQKKLDQEGISCAIDVISGDITAYSSTVKLNMALLFDLSAKDWHSQLCELAKTGERLFTGNKGYFAWCYPPTESTEQSGD